MKILMILPFELRRFTSTGYMIKKYIDKYKIINILTLLDDGRDSIS
jgi:hypothetical protein